MTTTPTPDTNSGETPTPRTDAEEFHASSAQNIMCVRASFARELERELSRPVAPITGMPPGCPETIWVSPGPRGAIYWGRGAHPVNPNMSDSAVEVEILPLGSRERLRALEAALTPSVETKVSYMGEFSFSVIEHGDMGDEDYMRSINVPWTTIKEIMAAIRAHAAPATPCLCGHTLGEHVPDKDIGCTGFRPV